LTSDSLGGRGGPFLPGEPVMITENDYELSLFNGDQGVMAWIGGQRSADLHAIFPRANDRCEAFPLAAVKPRLKHAFALTVHKAQGSEYRRVAVVLPPEDLPLLSRELVYTAFTRASRSVLVVGAEERMADAAGRSERRNTGVAERLRRPA
jgi:exodeoxyribonuclease V alpha subunit